MMAKERESAPLGIKILGWYGIVFGLMFMIVSVVSIVLSILDRTYKDIGMNFIIGLYGIPIFVVSVAFKNRQRWGWIGYAVLLGVIVIWSVVLMLGRTSAPNLIFNAIIGFLTLAVLAGILMPSIRQHFFTS